MRRHISRMAPRTARNVNLHTTRAHGETDRAEQSRALKRECLCLVCAAVLGGNEVTGQTPKASSSLSPDTLTLTKLGAEPN